MPTATATATAVAKQKAVAAKEPKMISAEERSAIKQQRAKLALELQHCEENLSIAEAERDRALNGDDSDQLRAAHKDYIAMRDKRDRKQTELLEHRHKFLSDEEIERRDREEQEAIEEAAREEARLKIAKPLQKRMLQALDDIFAAKAVFDEVHAMLSSGQASPLGNSYEVAVLCRTVLRNFQTPIPNHKFWMEGGGGKDVMRSIIEKCA